MEFNHAIKHRGTISILSYFRKQEIFENESEESKSQKQEVLDLKTKLESNNVTTMSYNDESEFAIRILPDIMEAALEMIFSKEPKEVTYENFRIIKVVS